MKIFTKRNSVKTLNEHFKQYGYKVEDNNLYRYIDKQWLVVEIEPTKEYLVKLAMELQGLYYSLTLKKYVTIPK